MIGFNEMQRCRALTAQKIEALNAWKHSDMDAGHNLDKPLPEIKYVGPMDDLQSAASIMIYALIGAGLFVVFRAILWAIT